ncbi:MAG: DUF3795 domain-containing protein [Dehalococcoidia bacterium]|nr:DUF3795 domain-containing protein [Dehalococcoidia bacterium]MDD5494811.1 DUF3795 domain-containing protein [Dehalococcoidia bacterium]
MIDKNALEAPCGLDCSMCMQHKAIGDENLKKKLSDMMQLLSDNVTVPADKVGCPGCRAIEGNCLHIGEQCLTYICTREKGVDFCSDCAEFPCIKLMPCADKSTIIPHNIKLYSLNVRKFKGEEEWKKVFPELYQLYFKGKMFIGRGPQPKS